MFNLFKKSDKNGSVSNGNAPKTRKVKGFYLALDEDSKVTEAVAPVEPAAVTAPVATTPAELASSVAEQVVTTAPEAVAAPQAEAPQAEAPKRVKKFRGQAPEQVVEVPAQTANGVKAEPTKVAVPAAVQTFATDFLLPKPGQTPRRRPGANMSSYLDMAKQMQK